MKRTICLALAVVIAAAFFIEPAQAQNDRVRNKIERAGDRNELRQDNRAVRDDLFDLTKLETLRTEFNEARATGDHKTIRYIDTEMSHVLAGERAESNKEVAEAKKEIRKDKREIRSDRQEVRENRRTGAPKRVKRRDRRDLRDDRRDLKDDTRDAAAEEAQRRDIRAISTAWKGMKGKYDPASLDQRARLLDELIRIAKVEVVRDRTEIKEDHRELREDRRETRQDRRRK